MKVVIVGAGNVGFTSAAALSKVHEVLVVEMDSLKADLAKGLLNVSVLHEDGSNPVVLKSAIEKINADIILSALPDDGLNLFVCMMSKRIKENIVTVACLRNPDFIINTTKEGKDGVDILISPELITADKIYNLAILENAVTYDYIENMDIALVTFRIDKGHDPVGKVVMELKLPEDCTVVAIYREDKTILDCATAEIRVNDRLFVLGSRDAIDSVNKLIGVEKEAKEFVILGASIVGISIAKYLSSGSKKRFTKIIDKDEEGCRKAAKELDDTIVINADVVDPMVLRSENVQRADVIISVSPADERNLLACMAALKFGTRKIISRYSSKEYEEIFKYTGVESIIGYHRVITNEITKNLVFDESAIVTLDRIEDNFFSVTLDKKSVLTGNRIGDIKIPEGVRIAAVIRNGKTIYPKVNTKFEIGDKVLLFTHMINPTKLSKLLGQVPVTEL